MKKSLFLLLSLIAALTLCFAAASANDYNNCWNGCCNPCYNGTNCCPQPPAPAPRNCALFEADVTYADGTYVAPGASFVKTWRIRNNGNTTWNTNYKLVFYSGNQMSAPYAVALPYSVAPGQSVEISVPMVAPNSAGTFKGEWMLESDNGQRFGIGNTCNVAFWVQITTVQPAPVWKPCPPQPQHHWPFGPKSDPKPAPKPGPFGPKPGPVGPKPPAPKPDGKWHPIH